MAFFFFFLVQVPRAAFEMLGDEAHGSFDLRNTGNVFPPFKKIQSFYNVTTQGWAFESIICVVHGINHSQRGMERGMYVCALCVLCVCMHVCKCVHV